MYFLNLIKHGHLGYISFKITIFVKKFGLNLVLRNAKGIYFPQNPQHGGYSNLLAVGEKKDFLRFKRKILGKEIAVSSKLCFGGFLR